MKTVILGVDLAWGRRMPDAVSEITVVDGGITVGPSYYSKGDLELLAIVRNYASITDRLVLSVDAPLVCCNGVGSRPVDKECNHWFRKYEAGCHPVNQQLCARPLELAKEFQKIGVQLSWDLHLPMTAMEVYPHPAMIRFFGLEKTLKYKRGRVIEKRKEFQKYQYLFKKWVRKEWSELALSRAFDKCLSDPWSKSVEDLLDSYLCSFIGLWHVVHAGERSQVLGSKEAGFMVIPTA